MSDTAAGSNTPDPDQPAPGTGDPAAVGTKGGGEWPSKDAPPTGAAPGSDPERAAALKAERLEHTTAGDATSAGELHPMTRLPSPYEQQPDQAAVGSTAVDEVEEELARDAGAARDRGERPIGAPTTELA
jgi:hypothetical protein